MWPKFEDELVGLRLAVTGAIKDSIINLQDVAVFGLRFLEEHYPERLKERYGLDEIPEDIAELFDAIGEKRGCLMSGGSLTTIRRLKSSFAIFALKSSAGCHLNSRRCKGAQKCGSLFFLG